MDEKLNSEEDASLEETLGASDPLLQPDAATNTSIGSPDFKEDCFALRGQIEETKAQTMVLFHEHPVFEDVPQGQDRGEMKANIMLAFRHLEDARMRLGKAVQAYDGGVSVYPK